ncbi:hypothetical protein B0O99DRAFT_604213 [Bisporella sp. PMI_857]|nr:hypothetical protein B0O99DRAFT_604213 [Bisporella sp. PMI_857]
MGLFSKKKGGDGDDDSNRSALFARSKNSSSPASATSNPYAQAPTPAASNPYAQQAVSDPYAQDTNKYANMPPTGSAGPAPYQQARQGISNGPGAGAPRNGLPGGPAASKGGYGSEKYGTRGGGYGASRYEEDSGSAGSKYGRPGGYGGFGSSTANDTAADDNREALFGGVKKTTPGQKPGANYAAPADDASSTSGGYGAYGDRQLTAEEEEEEDVAATKQQIRELKRQDVSSTRNALRIAEQAEESGRATLARLGAQGERIHNTEKNLDLAANHNRIAEEKAKELKTLNRSMFAVHVANPFTASSRREARDQEIIEKHRIEREQREATRQNAFASQQRMDGAFKGLQPGDAGYRAPMNKTSLAERSKYQFEADSEDEEMENEIDHNLDMLSGAAGRLNLLARATGKEVEEQNKHIDNIVRKTDRVDEQIVMNRARLDRIH